MVDTLVKEAQTLTSRSDWTTKSIEEIFHTATGRTPSKKNKLNYGNHTPFIKPPDLHDNFVENTIHQISQIGRSDARIAPEGAVLVTCIGNLGRTGILKQEAAFNQQINAIYPADEVLPEFVFYQAQSPSFVQQLEKLSSATTVAIVNKGKFNTIQFSYPPLPEQRAIVAKLERLFAELDRSVAELETAREKLGVYRQSVLKEAFGGRLTAGWRSQKISEEKDLIGLINEHLQHSYESNLAKYSKQVMDWNNSGKIGKGPDKPKRPTKITQLVGRDGKPKPIVSKMPLFLKVGDLCAVVRGGSPRPAGDPRYYDGDIPFLKVADLTREPGKYVTKFNYTIKEAGLQKTRRLTAGTLVISNSGATLGVPKILHINATANDGIAAFLHLPEEYIPFMYYFWVSQTEKLRNINQGAAQPNLNTNMLRDYLIPVFSLREQNKIVEEIETRFSVADKLEQEIAESLERARGLRQGVLKRAFAGELFK